MTAFLILLYVLRANGVIVPGGCLFIAWCAWIVKFIFALDGIAQRGG